jgi:hypothetical protein
MLVFTDLISGDEMLSDAYPLMQAMNADGTEVSFFML